MKLFYSLLKLYYKISNLNKEHHKKYIFVIVLYLLVWPIKWYFELVRNDTVIWSFKFCHKLFFEFFELSLYRLELSIILILIFLYFFFNKLKEKELKKNFIFYINFFFLVITLFFLIHVNNLISLIICIEIINVILYYIITIQKKKKNILSSEGLLKYFIQNGFFTFIFCFGSAIIFFCTNTLNFTQISLNFLLNGELLNNNFLLFGVSLIFISFFIKLGFIGFHKIIFEVYNSLDNTTYNLIGNFIKFYFFQAFGLMYINAFSFIIYTKLFYILLFYIIISLLYSTILVIYQKNIINFFFYSSISNYSLIFLMIILNDPKKVDYWTFYNLNYFIFTFLFFFILNIIQEKYLNKEITYINELNLIKKVESIYLFIIELVIITLGGFPFFPIFLGKFYFIYMLFNTYHICISLSISIIIIINICLSFYYFFKLFNHMLIERYHFFLNFKKYITFINKKDINKNNEDYINNIIKIKNKIITILTKEEIIILYEFIEEYLWDGNEEKNNKHLTLDDFYNLLYIWKTDLENQVKLMNSIFINLFFFFFCFYCLFFF